MPKSNDAGGLLSDFVIPAPDKLHKAKAVAKRIGHKSELAPPEHPNRLFEQRSRRDGSLNRRFDFINDKVEMHRRPMALISPSLRSCNCRRSPRFFHQEIYRSRTANHLQSDGAEAAADFQPKGRTVKAHRLIKVINVQIYDEIHEIGFRNHRTQL